MFFSAAVFFGFFSSRFDLFWPFAMLASSRSFQSWPTACSNLRTRLELALFRDTFEELQNRLDPVESFAALMWQQSQDLVLPARGGNSCPRRTKIDRLADPKLMTCHVIPP